MHRRLEALGRLVKSQEMPNEIFMIVRDTEMNASTSMPRLIRRLSHSKL